MIPAGDRQAWAVATGSPVGTDLDPSHVRDRGCLGVPGVGGNRAVPGADAIICHQLAADPQPGVGVIYLGVALPVIGVGFIALATGLLVAVQIFAYLVGAACLAGLIAQRVDARRSGRLAPATERS